MLVLLGVYYEHSSLAPIIAGVGVTLPVLWLVFVVMGAAQSARIACARLPRAARHRSLVAGIPLLTPQSAAGLVAFVVTVTLQFSFVVLAFICVGLAMIILSKW